MSNNLRIALDAMGGDNAPFEIVKGAVEAIKDNDNIIVVLIGDEDLISEELSKYQYDNSKIEIVHASEVIDNCESPVTAIRKKKDSSMVKGFKLLKEKNVDSFISAGSTGALLAGGTLLLRRIKGIERPALAPLIPTINGVSLLIDAGANVDAKPSYLVQYAMMGHVYTKNILGIDNPQIGLINIGEEVTKGNNLVKETYPLLKEGNFNFIGNVEAREIISGKADVLVCDGFVGNVILKHTEGFGKTILQMLKEALTSNTKSKIGALLIKDSLKKTLKKFDYNQYGGAPLLGSEGLVVKAHGNADSNIIKNTIVQCIKFSEQNIIEKIKQNL